MGRINRWRPLLLVVFKTMTCRRCQKKDDSMLNWIQLIKSVCDEMRVGALVSSDRSPIPKNLRAPPGFSVILTTDVSNNKTLHLIC